MNAFQLEITLILLHKCSITSLNDQNVYRLETFLPITTKQSCLALSLILFGSVLGGSSKIFKKFSINIFNTDVHVSSPFTFANFRNAGTERNRFRRSCREYSWTSMNIELSRISFTSSNGTWISTYFRCLIPI